MSPFIHKNVSVHYYSILHSVFSDMKPNFFMNLKHSLCTVDDHALNSVSKGHILCLHFGSGYLLRNFCTEKVKHF